MKIFPFKLDISLPEKVTVPESISESFKTDAQWLFYLIQILQLVQKFRPHRYQS